MDVGALLKDQYRIVEHIGRGGMADVWSAQDLRLGRMVAIKTIAQGLSPDSNPIERFQTEAQTIAKIEHPHILPIYDFGEYQNDLYIVMRYMPGGSLEDLLATARLELDDMLRLAEAIAQALDFAHSQHIMHLDLKPPNILIDSTQTPYLADFGLATTLDPQGRGRNPGSGTLMYMAPEQMTSTLVDRRADIYSFSIMLFYMLCGQLPFAGETPLAVRQLHRQTQLPPMDTLNPDLPPTVTDILRRGTALRPEDRPDTHLQIVEELRAALAASLRPDMAAYGGELQSKQGAVAAQLGDYSGASELLEAMDIYSRARLAWAGGQGRFLLGLTHYLLMAGYYRQAGLHKLSFDRVGLQMLLRGALEYDYEVDYWWEQLDDESRRLVTLHALRTGTVSARLRALNRLETLSDDADEMLIPRLVSQALEVEQDEEARIAALRVLRTRARLLKPSQRFAVQTAYRGRLLTTITRLGLESMPAPEWEEFVYAPEIDLLLAERALADESPEVAEEAARTVAQMRSLTALSHLANAQRNMRPRALQALALVRDELGALPDIVSPQARLYAWLMNTWRRITQNPLESILRLVLVLMGAWIGMGEMVYTTFRAQALFSSPRWSSTLAIGLIFSIFLTLSFYFADELSRRLRGFWPWWVRLLVSASLGFLLATLTWASFRWLFFSFVQDWAAMRLAGAGLAFGFVASSLLNLRPWQAVPLTAISIYLPLLALHLSFYETTSFSVWPAAGLGIAFGAVMGWLLYWQQSRQLQPRQASAAGQAPLRDLGLAFSMGLLLSALLWGLHAYLYSQLSITWDMVLILFALGFVPGFLGAYMLRQVNRLAFLGAALASFIALGIGLTPQFMILPFSPPPDAPIFYFDDTHLAAQMILVTTLPMSFVIALAANLQAILQGWWQRIGPSRSYIERSPWLASVLAWVMGACLMVSILSLFSMHVSVPWSLAWSAWGFLGFVAGLAAWRWARWGAIGLILLGLAFLAGALAYDWGQIPALLWGEGALFTIVASVGLGFFTVATLRRHLWGALGLVLLMLLWVLLALFNPFPVSMILFALAHMAVLAYALLPEWDLFEQDRWPFVRALLPDAVKRDESARLRTIRFESENVGGTVLLDVDTQRQEDAGGSFITEMDPDLMRADLSYDEEDRPLNSPSQSRRPATAAPDMRTKILDELDKPVSGPATIPLPLDEGVPLDEDAPLDEGAQSEPDDMAIRGLPKKPTAGQKTLPIPPEPPTDAPDDSS